MWSLVSHNKWTLVLIEIHEICCDESKSFLIFSIGLVIWVLQKLWSKNRPLDRISNYVSSSDNVDWKSTVGSKWISRMSGIDYLY